MKIWEAELNLFNNDFGRGETYKIIFSFSIALDLSASQFIILKFNFSLFISKLPFYYLSK